MAMTSADCSVALQLGCWSLVDNNAALHKYTAGNGTKKSQSLVEPSGYFIDDFRRACASINVVPHPKLIQAHITRPEKNDVADNDSSSENDKEKCSSEGNEEQKKITQLQVFGWALDLGSVTALSLTLPSCSSLVTLRFWNAGLSAEVIKALAGAIRNSSVTRLYLDWNPLTSEESAECLTELANTPLKVLSARGNNLTHDAVRPFIEALVTLSTLVALNLGSNNLGDETAHALASLLRSDRSLISLSLAHTDVTDSGLIALLQVLKPFRLDVAEAKMKARFTPRGPKLDDGSASCSGNAVLRHLVLSYCNVGDDGATAALDLIQENHTLTHLSLTRNDFSNAIIERLIDEPRVLVERSLVCSDSEEDEQQTTDGDEETRTTTSGGDCCQHTFDVGEADHNS